jgi:3-oxoacid CoA-transferase subunit B
MVVTDLGVVAIDRKSGGMTLLELADGVSLDEFRAKTEAGFALSPTLKAAA